MVGSSHSRRFGMDIKGLSAFYKANHKEKDQTVTPMPPEADENGVCRKYTDPIPDGK